MIASDDENREILRLRTEFALDQYVAAGIAELTTALQVASGYADHLRRVAADNPGLLEMLSSPTDHSDA